jgi:hypothetical protein
MLTRSARLGRKVGLYLRLRHPSSKVHEISKKIKRIVFLEIMKIFIQGNHPATGMGVRRTLPEIGRASALPR